ncbi:hypothetical protein LG293_17640 (plasmid) [Citricoccus nitrophenolicus]
MFVVLELNQAGGLLELPLGADLHHHREDAEAERDRLAAQSRESGRRDRYMVATVDLDDEGEG